MSFFDRVLTYPDNITKGVDMEIKCLSDIVPNPVMQNRTTGFSLLDRALQKGYANANLVSVWGKRGTGKSVFLLHFWPLLS